MINKLIDEINVALNSGLHLIALIAALTLPDVCGKAEYPKLKVGERYTTWLSNYISDNQLPADEVYALRCSLLHEGSTNADGGSGVMFKLQTNRFAQQLGIEFCVASTVTRRNKTREKTVTVYVGYLCSVICKAAKEYYVQNKDKFSFLNYRIVDLADELGFFGF